MENKWDVVDEVYWPQYLVAARTYLHAHFAETISVAGLAEQANVNVDHFIRQFTRFLGSTPIAYLQQVRMEHAFALLCESSLSIAEIARRVGYDDPAYFSRVCTRHFGRSPRQLREANRRHTLADDTVIPPAASSRERWVLVYAQDFEQTTALDQRWSTDWRENASATTHRAPERAVVENGMLRLLPEPWRTTVRWQEPIPVEAKVEAVIANTSQMGLNLALSVSGDTWNGYCLRMVGYDYIVLERQQAGQYEVLAHVPYQLSSTAREYRVALWRVGNMIAADIDGVRVLNYYDPLAAQGPDHQTVSLSRFWENGSADFRALRISFRRMPKTLDVLEPGRVLLRSGNALQAAAWLEEVLQDMRTPRLRHEARYLAALARFLSPAVETLKLTAVALAHDTPFANHALWTLMLHHLTQGDYSNAVAMAGELSERGVDPTQLQGVGEQLNVLLSSRPSEERRQILAYLALCPLTSLNLAGLAMTMLPDLAGMPLKYLKIDNNPIDTLLPLAQLPLIDLRAQNCRVHDLAPLNGMPLISLYVDRNCISDLEPLSGMPLQKLSCNFNQISDLTPLTNCPLKELSCMDNPVQSLAPLRKMPLVALNCDDTPIANLDSLRGMALEYLSISHARVANLMPLHGMPLRFLNINDNTVSSILPLRGMPLYQLNVAGNKISDLRPLQGAFLRHLQVAHNLIADLTPLQGIPLNVLDCRGNRIISLAPLRGMFLRELHCSGNPLEDLTPLRGMPIHLLDIGNIPLTTRNREVIADLPLEAFYCDADHWEAMDFVQNLPNPPAINGQRQ